MRLFGQTIIAATAAALALLVAPACADNDQSIFINAVLAPPASQGGGTCVYSNDAEQTRRFEGVVDVSLRDNYAAVVLVGSQLLPRADPTAPRSESNRAKITGAIVRVSDANDNTIGEFTSVSTGVVAPAQGGQAAFGAAQITAIDAPTMQKIGSGLARGQTKLVIANIRAFGETIGGVDLETAEYAYPIRVCNQCLILFTGFDDPLTQGVDCNLQAQTGGTGGGGGAGGGDTLPCYPGQDEFVACTLCQNVESPPGSGNFPCRGPTQ